MSGAARRLRLSQPALSIQIRRFEEQLGCSLFTRSTNRLKLTAAGRIVQRCARRMFALSDDLMEALSDRGAAKRSHLRIGVCPGIERPFSVRLVRLLLNAPGEPFRVKLATGTERELLKRLEEDSLDVVLSDRPMSDFAILADLEMPVVFVAGRDSISADLSSVLSRSRHSTAALKEWTGGLVLPSQNFRLRWETDKFLRKHRLRAPVHLESDQLAAATRAVEDGVGAGFFPLPYIIDRVKRGVLKLGGPPQGLWRHSLWLLARRGVVRSPAVRELQRVFHDFVQEIQLPLSKKEHGRSASGSDPR